MMNRTTYPARALCAAAATFVSLASGAVFAQATGGQSGSSDNAPAARPDSTTATGTTSRTDSATGRDATRNRARNDSANPSGQYVPRTGSTSHQDRNGNVVKDQSTGGSPQGRERPPASPPNIPATHP
ncbi:hypothetical protein C0Q88_10565 [Ralstonia pickettii]|uniref:Uncharacterized protein n=1 Tax=Ralstonia pickettii TaxID=329 RepID=A0A2N4TRS6_RALPI|nr:hypothetical protein [Ralstonia pickettii]PLC42406.1 hypothetical protein C0Q88_10565 [Ralstonia pickettii]